MTFNRHNEESNEISNNKSDATSCQELSSISEYTEYDDFDPYDDIEIYIESENGLFNKWNRKCDKLLNKFCISVVCTFFQKLKQYCVPIMSLLIILCIISSIILTFGGFLITICIALIYLIYLIAHYQIIRWILIVIICFICFVIFIIYVVKFIKKIIGVSEPN